MRLTAGSFRELHWHTADEWAIMLSGTARVTVLTPDGTAFVDDVGKNDLWYFPAGYPHSIQGLDPEGCEFLLVFDEGMFSEDNTFLLSEWLAHTPRSVLTKNLGLGQASLAKLPTDSLYIFPAELPKTLAQDRAAVGAQQSRSPYTFKMGSMAPTKRMPGGEVRVVDSHNFPVSTNIAAAMVTVHPGAMRELHWHPNASEWQYYVAGKGRMTVFMPVDSRTHHGFQGKRCRLRSGNRGTLHRKHRRYGPSVSRDVQSAAIYGFFLEQLAAASSSGSRHVTPGPERGRDPDDTGGEDGNHRGYQARAEVTFRGNYGQALFPISRWRCRARLAIAQDRYLILADAGFSFPLDCDPAAGRIGDPDGHRRVARRAGSPACVWSAYVPGGYRRRTAPRVGAVLARLRRSELVLFAAATASLCFGCLTRAGRLFPGCPPVGLEEHQHFQSEELTRGLLSGL